MAESLHGGDETTSYDTEYRSKDDDAWYSVGVVLSDDGETMTVKFQGFDGLDLRLTAGEFKSVAEVDEFLERFRPVSNQLQDDECYKVFKGMTVCAALSYRSDDLRFYDAVVDAVEHQAHSLTDGEEECLCSYILCWLHGPMLGNLTLVKIANICTIQAAGQVDPGLTSFSKLAKEKILAACSKSCIITEHCTPALGFGGPLSCKEIICLSSNQKSSSESRLQDSELESCCHKRTEDKERVNFRVQGDSDEDVGGTDAVESGGFHFLLIDNLEKDLSTSAIRRFIQGHMHVSLQVHLFPSRSSVPSGSGAIASDSKENIEKIYAFLSHPKHLIVSGRGRPWVVSEKVLNGSCRAILGGLLPQSQDKFQWQSLNKELKVVHLGTEAYKTAKQLRDLFVDFVNHEQLLYERLALEETKILKSSQSRDTDFSLRHRHDVKVVLAANSAVLWKNGALGLISR